MNAKRLLTIAVAATVLLGGMVAAGAAVPADAQANDNTPVEAGDAPDNTSEHADTSERENGTTVDRGDAAENASDRAGERGPPGELPDAVPDHVTEIHDSINSFIDGEIEDLGATLSGLLSDDGDAADAGDANEDADASDAGDAGADAGTGNADAAANAAEA